jgi:hypothetical protein
MELNKAVLNRDFTVIADKSGSMSDPVGDGNITSRWESVRESTVAVARKLGEFHPGGITLYTFSDRFSRFDNATPEKIDETFRNTDPCGSTALHSVLHHAFETYFSRRDKGQAQSGGESFFIVTDGKPDDEHAVVREIVAATKRINNPKELSITFLQVGNDAHATDYLHRLDDELAPAGAKYDIVDTITFSQLSGKNLTDVITTAITEHKQST